MNEAGKLNIYETTKPTNKDIYVAFLPSNNVKSYTIDVYKDNKLYNQTEYDKVLLYKTGTYKIKVSAILTDDTLKIIESGEYVIDKEAPIITLKQNSLKIKRKDVDKIKTNASVKDNMDKKVKIEVKNINMNKEIQNVMYIAKDEAGNMTQKTVNVRFENIGLFIGLYSVLLALILVIIHYIRRYKKALSIENRISPFTVKTVNYDTPSISEHLIKQYQTITRKISKSFNKSVIAKKYTKRLEKYIPVTNIHKTSEDIFAGKIIAAFIFVIIALISKIISFKIISGYEVILIFTFGFFVLDVLYFIKYKVFRWKLESDFIAAITIMNNSFKSGRSITQSIDTVAEELEGPMGEEFHRMSLEILYGLEIDVVFERFAKRIGMEEANYLTASLTILNKTGGDIIKVFNSIERNMFDKRKLKLELASLTSGSKIVVGTLLGMPFFFALVISMINKDYFLPLITTDIGRILLLFMIIYYIIFVVVVRKIMKVVI